VIAHAAALGAVVGAWCSVPVPGSLVLTAAVGAVRWRRAPVVLCAMFLLGSFLGDRALQGLDPPSPQAFGSWVTLLDDPRPNGNTGVIVTVRWQGRRLEASAFGAAGARLDDRLAGERVLVEGRVRPADTDWLRWRHIVGRMTVDRVLAHGSAPPIYAAANWVRRHLSEGAESLSREHRSLYTGMILGDDRDQSAATADDFRAAGLGHLLVVSGQNVAFVLALVAPLTTRLRPGGRLVAVLVVLSIFAVLTRFEPSVMRAVTMSALAVGSAVLGRPEDGRRVLAAAIALCVLIDPFLVHAAAFQLSVAATGGIIWLTPHLVELIPAPRPIALALATTIGAQVAVTPLLVVMFGTVPLASLPANLLAGPASGPVMMWGCTGGMVAGLSGGWVAEVIHWPTTALLWWVGSVARAAALAPPVSLGRSAGAIVVVSVLALVVSRRGRSRSLAVLAITLVLVVAVQRAPTPPAGWSEIDGAAVWSSQGSTLVVLNAPRSPERLLGALRSAGIGRPDLVVATRGGAADAYAVIALRARFAELAIIAPPLHRVPGARTARVGQVIRIGDSVVEIVAVDPEIEVSIDSSGPTRS
jgi:competence protein ComEC